MKSKYNIQYFDLIGDKKFQANKVIKIIVNFTFERISEQNKLLSCNLESCDIIEPLRANFN